MKKKILFINHAKGIGGASINMMDMINSLDKTLFDVKVLFLYDTEATGLLDGKNINFQIINSWFIKRVYRYFCHTETGYLKYYQIIRIIRVIISWLVVGFFLGRRILKYEDPDLVYLNSSVLTDWAYASKRCGYKVICNVQETLTIKNFGFRIKFIRYILQKYIDRIFIISEYNASILKLSQNYNIIYNSVDFKVFNTDFYLKKEKEVINIAYLGGQAELKGFSWLVESLKYLDERIKVHFAGYYKSGENSLTSKLKSLISYRKRRTNKNLKLMRISANALEIGVIKDIPEFLSKCDILVFPSTKSHFARPVIEANAMKIPVVISDIPGNNEIVQNGVNGFLVKKNSPLALAEKINLLSRNSDMRKKMGKKGYEIARDKFDAEKNVKDILRIYSDLLP